MELSARNALRSKFRTPRADRPDVDLTWGVLPVKGEASPNDDLLLPPPRSARRRGGRGSLGPDPGPRPSADLPARAGALGRNHRQAGVAPPCARDRPLLGGGGARAGCRRSAGLTPRTGSARTGAWSGGAGRGGSGAVDRPANAPGGTRGDANDAPATKDPGGPRAPGALRLRLAQPDRPDVADRPSASRGRGLVQPVLLGLAALRGDPQDGHVRARDPRLQAPG